MGEYAQMDIDNADWNDPYFGEDFDNFFIKKDAKKTHPKLCLEVSEKYNIIIPCALEKSFIYKCLVFYQKNKYLSKNQINKCLELDEVRLRKVKG